MRLFPLSISDLMAHQTGVNPQPNQPDPPTTDPCPHNPKLQLSIPISVDDPPPDGENISQEVQLLLDVRATGDDNEATPNLNPEPPEDDMTVDVDDASDQKERPKRHTSRPQLYQSDEVERMEKEKRRTSQL
jgi:hypothetical protein